MGRSWTCVAVAALLAVGAAPPAWSSAPAVAPAPGAASRTADLAALAPEHDAGAVLSPDAFRPRRGHPLHVALGDSLPAGQQSVPPAVDFPTTAALWKANGFVARFHGALRYRLDCSPGHGPRTGGSCRHLGLVNLARTGIPGGPGGVTTATVLQPGDQLDQAVALLTARNQDRSPRNDVEVVTVSVGGNDLFGPAVQACVLSTEACVATVDATLDGFADRYDRILRTLRETAGPGTVVLTNTYYNPLPYCYLGVRDPAGAQRVGDAILEGGDVAPGVTLPEGFNDRLREVAARHDVTVVDAFGLLGADDLVGGHDCVHPDGSGHRALARAFVAALPD